MIHFALTDNVRLLLSLVVVIGAWLCCHGIYSHYGTQRVHILWNCKSPTASVYRLYIWVWAEATTVSGCKQQTTITRVLKTKIPKRNSIWKAGRIYMFFFALTYPYYFVLETWWHWYFSRGHSDILPSIGPFLWEITRGTELLMMRVTSISVLGLIYNWLVFPLCYL